MSQAKSESPKRGEGKRSGRLVSVSDTTRELANKTTSITKSAQHNAKLATTNLYKIIKLLSRFDYITRFCAYLLNICISVRLISVEIQSERKAKSFFFIFLRIFHLLHHLSCQADKSNTPLISDSCCSEQRETIQSQE